MPLLTYMYTGDADTLATAWFASLQSEDDTDQWELDSEAFDYLSYFSDMIIEWGVKDQTLLDAIKRWLLELEEVLY